MTTYLYAPGVGVEFTAERRVNPEAQTDRDVLALWGDDVVVIVGPVVDIRSVLTRALTALPPPEGE